MNNKSYLNCLLKVCWNFNDVSKMVKRYLLYEEILQNNSLTLIHPQRKYDYLDYIHNHFLLTKTSEHLSDRY